MTGSVILKCRSFCQKCAVCQDRWCLMAVVSQDRFHCSLKFIFKWQAILPMGSSLTTQLAQATAMSQWETFISRSRTVSNRTLSTLPSSQLHSLLSWFGVTGRPELDGGWALAMWRFTMFCMVVRYTWSLGSWIQANIRSTLECTSNSYKPDLHNYIIYADTVKLLFSPIYQVKQLTHIQLTTAACS